MLKMILKGSNPKWQSQCVKGTSSTVFFFLFFFLCFFFFFFGGGGGGEGGCRRTNKTRSIISMGHVNTSHSCHILAVTHIGLVLSSWGWIIDTFPKTLGIGLQKYSKHLNANIYQCLLCMWLWYSQIVPPTVNIVSIVIFGWVIVLFSTWRIP